MAHDIALIMQTPLYKSSDFYILQLFETRPNSWNA